jgi:hypothetical protein
VALAIYRVKASEDLGGGKERSSRQRGLGRPLGF